MPQTSFFHGVTVSLIDVGPRPIAIPSSSIIGLVDTYTPGTGLAEPDVPVLLTSYREAVMKFGVDAAISKAARGIYEQSSAVIVAVGVPVIDTGDDAADQAALVSAIIGGVTIAGSRTGLQALLDGKSRFNAQPRLLVAAGHSKTQAVATAMDAIATKLRAIAIIDGPDTDDDDAYDYAGEFGSKRVYLVDPGVKVWDTETNAEITVPASPYVAGLFCRTDKEYGFWASPSNKEFLGVIGTTRPVEFLDGDDTCRANLLNNSNITTIIRDGGYRLWGNRTLSADQKWAFVTRVRTLDIVMDAILYAHKWAVDRSITKTYVKDVTEGLQNFMRHLKALGAIVNFEVYPDRELNTADQLEQGRVYWNIRFTDVPPAENPQFRVEVTNQWITEVLDINEGAK
ncbi:MAG: phage tail sheath family protein [Desulfobulbus sp.]|nr:phage tail sheath family protein [Desulfobulbus sp.]